MRHLIKMVQQENSSAQKAKLLGKVIYKLA
jgi:hypothetical protein